MNKSLLLIWATLYMLFGCQENFTPKDYHQLSGAEILDRKTSKQWDLSQTTFLDRNFQAVHQLHIDSFKQNLVGLQFYVRDPNQASIDYAIITDWTLSDKLNEAIAVNYDSSLLQPAAADTTIDCNQLPQEIARQYDIYNGQTYNGLAITFENMFSIREKRLVAILQHCSYEQIAALSRDDRRKLWLEYQHKTKEIRATFYYPLINRLFADEVFDAEARALSQDRIFIEANYPQIYGSQLMNGQLWPIRDTTDLDSIRVSMGMLPLDEYLETF